MLIYFFRIPPYMIKLLAGYEQVSLKPMHKVKEQTVSSTFNLVMWFLNATYHLIMITICAKSFSYPTMHSKVMGRTRTGFPGLCTEFKRRL